MKIAISGKGGVGKTTITALLAHSFAKSGKRVIVIDADPDSNLASTLGLPEKLRSKIKPISQLFDLIEERTGARPGSSYSALFSLNPKVDDLLEKYGLKIDNNITLLILGTIQSPNSGCFCPQNALLKSLLAHLLFERNEVVILDMEAGLEHLGRGSIAGVDWLLIISELGTKSRETSLRIANLARELGIKNIGLILNKVKNSEYAELGLDILGAIPYDQSIEQSELSGQRIRASQKTLSIIGKIIEKIFTF